MARATFLPRFYRVTSRLVCEIIHAFKKVVSAKEIGWRYNVSGVTAMRYFILFNKKPTKLPEVISLDEFKGNSGGQKYHSVVVDPKEKKVLDILPNRYENNLVKCFSQFSDTILDCQKSPEDFFDSLNRSAPLGADRFPFVTGFCR